MRSFKCPQCSINCGAETRDDGSASLYHPYPRCSIKAGDLLRGYVMSLKPPERFPSLEDAKKLEEGKLFS